MTPAYHMWDPSKAVLFAFALFFAMIIADAGYGVVLGVILWAMWKRMGATASGRGLRGVMLTLVIFSIVYGVLLGSYCGVEPSEGSGLGALHILHVNDQSMMMWLVDWRRRGAPCRCQPGHGLAAPACPATRSVAWGGPPSSWAASASGWGKPIPLTALSTLGWIGLVLGGLLVLLFHSERPFSLAPKQLLGRLVDGLKGLLELSKAFGDVLSYLRLFALGLAAVKLAEVFNHLAAASFEAKGVGVLLGVLILLVGHAINFAMGIMGGVVHCLRLNLIEFFNWSLPEEGQRFEALTKKAKP